MLYRIFLIVFFILNLCFKSFGQNNFVDILEQGGAELQHYIAEQPPQKWSQDEILQVYQVFKKVDFSKKNELYDNLGQHVILKSIRLQTFVASMSVKSP